MGIRNFGGILFCLLCSVAVNAQQYAVVDRIPFSGDQTYWDYLTSDAANHHLYVTRGNEVLILDLESGKEVADPSRT